MNAIILLRTPANWTVALVLLLLELLLLIRLLQAPAPRRAFLESPMLWGLQRYLAWVTIPAGALYLFTPWLLDQGWLAVLVCEMHLLFAWTALMALRQKAVVRKFHAVCMFAAGVAGVLASWAVTAEPYPHGPAWRYYLLTCTFILCAGVPLLSAVMGAEWGSREFWHGVNVGVYFGVNALVNGASTWSGASWWDLELMKLGAHVGNVAGWLALTAGWSRTISPSPSP